MISSRRDKRPFSKLRRAKRPPERSAIVETNLNKRRRSPLPVLVSESRPLTEPAAEIDAGAVQAAMSRVINKSLRKAILKIAKSPASTGCALPQSAIVKTNSTSVVIRCGSKSRPLTEQPAAEIDTGAVRCLSSLTSLCGREKFSAIFKIAKSQPEFEPEGAPLHSAIVETNSTSVAGACVRSKCWPSTQPAAEIDSGAAMSPPSLTSLCGRERFSTGRFQIAKSQASIGAFPPFSQNELKQGVVGAPLPVSVGKEPASDSASCGDGYRCCAGGHVTSLTSLCGRPFSKCRRAKRQPERALPISAIVKNELNKRRRSPFRFEREKSRPLTEPDAEIDTGAVLAAMSGVINKSLRKGRGFSVNN
ncbi:hypothetical protein CEXT_674861 [Caerostris extrusa]|uniref:Uncharacterized protein n=1 Tax=Caerostris extrusa TaxID=172846 RepID=A0AAV4MMN4_CAEEX|nr:hypothetical protein CEXT_674861 [Caerostris extrusa]